MFKFTRKPNEYGDFENDGYYQDNGFDETAGENFEETGFDAPIAPAEAVPPAGAAALKIMNPKSYQDAAEIAGFLMNGNTVLLNIENMAREQAVRLLDYLSGATYVVGGLMTKVGKTTIVVAPKNVDVSSIEAMVGN